MSGLYQDLENRARKVLTLQVISALVAAAGFFVWKGGLAALSAGFGGGIGIASTLLLSYGVKKATVAAAQNPGASMRILYLGAAQRFFLVLALFAIALAVLKLEPLALFSGFALAQAAYFLSVRQLKNK